MRAIPPSPAQMSAVGCSMWYRCARRTERASGSRVAHARRTIPRSVGNRSCDKYRRQIGRRRLGRLLRFLMCCACRVMRRGPRCPQRPHTLALAQVNGKGPSQQQHTRNSPARQPVCDVKPSSCGMRVCSDQLVHVRLHLAQRCGARSRKSRSHTQSRTHSDRSDVAHTCLSVGKEWKPG